MPRHAVGGRVIGLAVRHQQTAVGVVAADQQHVGAGPGDERVDAIRIGGRVGERPPRVGDGVVGGRRRTGLATGVDAADDECLAPGPHHGRVERRPTRVGRDRRPGARRRRRRSRNGRGGRCRRRRNRRGRRSGRGRRSRRGARGGGNDRIGRPGLVRPHHDRRHRHESDRRDAHDGTTPTPHADLGALRRAHDRVGSDHRRPVDGGQVLTET